MHSSTPDASITPARSGWRGRPVEDVIYQVVTVGAILLVLGSLWVF
ncbi:MAG TPA: hypothetical protein VMD29_15225 [Terracidiphilus sp.]|nr:hypothetical protein [Terracidiphilus sp.]